MEQPLLDSEILATDWLCVRCGYNLRGLNRSGRCPECNTPIPRSLRTRYLAGSSHHWLRDVRDGALVLSACSSVQIIRDILLEVPVWIHLPPGVLRGILSNGVHLTLYAIECVGIWLITKREPLSIDTTAIRTASWARRLYLVGFFTSVIYRFLMLPYFLRDVSRVWAIAELLLFIPAQVLFWKYLAKLAQRLPNLVLEGRFLALAWLAPLGTTVGSLIPDVLAYFHFWRLSTTRRVSQNRMIIRVSQAPPLVLCAYAFRLAIAALVVVVLWNFARSLKVVLTAAPEPTESGTS
jgi:hypothetical protein